MLGVGIMIKKKILTKNTKKQTLNVRSKKNNPDIGNILAYCGYKLEGKKIVPSAVYNPVPYEGI